MQIYLLISPKIKIKVQFLQYNFNFLEHTQTIGLLIKNNSSEEVKSNDETINKLIEYDIFEKELKQSHFIFAALYGPIYVLENKKGIKEVELFTDETKNDINHKLDNHLANSDYKKVN